MNPTSQHIRWSPAVVALLVLVACGDGPPSAPVRPVASRAALDGSTCQFTAAHTKHGLAACTTCHACVGVVEFDPAGAAVVAGQAAPVFDAGSKSCSNVACHGVRAGTFSYWFQDGSGEITLNVFAYGSAPKPTPSWFATGIGCSGCHDNPPRNSTWHGGHHANEGPSGAANQCQFCHPDATGSNGAGTAITMAALHGNGTVEVQARFVSRCFTCH